MLQGFSSLDNEKKLLECHLKAEHSRYVVKDDKFFQQKLDAVNARKLDVSGAVCKSNSAALVESSYMVAYRVAKAKKPHTITEKLVLPCTNDTVSLVVRKEHIKKLDGLSVSDNTIQRQICDICQRYK